jgi:predicted hydrocarbon binding protein
MGQTISRVKGGKISSKFTFLKQEYGDGMVGEVLRSMSPGDQLELKIVLETAWYPFELYERLVLAICKVAARGDDGIYTKMGHHSAQRALTTTYKVFRGKNPVDLLKKLIDMQALRNDPAEMQVVPEGPNRCVVKVLKPKSTLAICKVSKAFYERAVELCGGKNVRVKETQCSGGGSPSCLFDISWENEKTL